MAQRRLLAEDVNRFVSAEMSDILRTHPPNDILEREEERVPDLLKGVKAWDESGITLFDKDVAVEAVKIQMLAANIAHVRYYLLNDRWQMYLASTRYRRCLT